MAFLGGAFEYARNRSWDGVQEMAFKIGFMATGGAIVAYLFGLVTGLY